MAIELGDAIWRIGADDSQFRAKLGATLTAAGAAITATLGKAGYDAAQFGQLMANVSTLGVTNLAELDKGAREVATTFGLDVNDAAKTLYDTISAGIPQDAAIMVMEQAAKGAQAGVGSLAEAMDLGTSVLNAWNMKGATANETAQNMASVMGEAATAIKAGKTTIADMAGAIGQVAPVMAAGNVSSKEFFASLAALTATGKPTSSAMAALQQVVAGIIKPTSEASKLAKKLGIDFSVTAIKSKGFAAFLADIQEKTGGDVELLGQLFGSVEALGAVISLTGNQADAFTSTLEAMGDAQKNLNTMSAEYIKNNPALAFAQLKAELQNMSVVLGRAILPAVTQLVQWIRPVVENVAAWIENNSALAQTLVTVAGGVGLLLGGLGPIGIIGPGIVAVMSAFGAVLSTLSVPILAVGAALGAGAYVLYQYYQAWGGWPRLWEWINNTVAQAREWLAVNWEQITEIFAYGKSSLISIGEMLWKSISFVFGRVIPTTFNNFINLLGPIFEKMTGVSYEGTNNVLDSVESFARQIDIWLKNINQSFDAFLQRVDGFWKKFEGLTDFGTTRIGNILAGFWKTFGPLLTWNPVRDYMFAAPATSPALASSAIQTNATALQANSTQAAGGGGSGAMMNITFNIGNVRSDDDIREIERGVTRGIFTGLQAAGVMA